jgi:hypothetical protein
MPVSNTDNSWSYTGNGVTVLFGYHGLIFAETDLKVYLQEISSGDLGDPLALGVDYTVSGVGVSAGGNVDLTAHGAPSALYRVVILREVPADQLAQLQDDGPFPAADTTRMVDKATVLVQQEKAAGARSLRLHPADQFTSLVLPLAAHRAGLQLGFDDNGDLQLSLPGTPGLGSVGAPELAADAVTAPAITSNGVAQQAILTRLGMNWVSLVKQGGAVGDGVDTTNAAAINAALSYALANALPTIMVDAAPNTRLYKMSVSPNALTSNVSLVGPNKEIAVFETAFDPPNATDPIFDMSEGGGAQGICARYGAGRNKGRMFYVRPAATGGFQIFRGNMLTYAGSAPTDVDYFFYANGEDAVSGIRDLAFSDNYLFGPALFKDIVNLGGTCNYMHDVRLEDTANVNLSTLAVREVDIVNTFAFLFEAGYTFGPVTIDNLSSGIYRTGAALDRTNFTNSSSFAAIETPLYRDYRNAEVKTGLLQVTQLGGAFDSTPGDGSNGLYAQVPFGTGKSSLASYSSGGSTELLLGSNDGGGAIRHGISISPTQQTVFGDADNAEAYRTLINANTAQHLFTARNSDGSRANVGILQNNNDTSPPRLRLIKGKGVGTAHGAVASGQVLGEIQAMGDDGSTHVAGGSLRWVVSQTPGAGDMPTDLVAQLVPDGSATLAEVWRMTQAGAMEMGGSGNTVISGSRHHRLRSYTVGTAPSAANAGELAWFSNESGGATGAQADGTNWRRFADRNIIS